MILCPNYIDRSCSSSFVPILILIASPYTLQTTLLEDKWPSQPPLWAPSGPFPSRWDLGPEYTLSRAMCYTFTMPATPRSEDQMAGTASLRRALGLWWLWSAHITEFVSKTPTLQELFCLGSVSSNPYRLDDHSHPISCSLGQSLGKDL